VKVEAAGVELAYAERGAGDATVLVHGMAAAKEDWAAEADALPGRVIAYDRRGYGKSGAPEPYVRTTVHEQAEDLAALIRALDAAPALLVGADLGALVCLDVLLRHRDLARAAILIDPPLFAFVPAATEALSEERATLEAAVRADGPGAGVAAWLGDGADPARRERAIASPRAFFADYGAIATLPLTHADLKSLTVPIHVMTTPGAPHHTAAAATALLAAAPTAVRTDSLSATT
jgi:pimeloyl-ACP methyl ester carboxylesterase